MRQGIIMVAIVLSLVGCQHVPTEAQYNQARAACESLHDFGSEGYIGCMNKSIPNPVNNRRQVYRANNDANTSAFLATMGAVLLTKPQPQPRQMLNCNSHRYGNQTNTTCW